MWELDYRAEHWRIDAFGLRCWRRLLRVSWTARRSNQSILKEISPEYSLQGLMLKLKLWYFGTWCEELTHWKRPWTGKDWRQEEKGMTEDEMVMASLTQWTWVSKLWNWWSTGRPHVHGVAKGRTWLSNWTELNWTSLSYFVLLCKIKKCTV